MKGYREYKNEQVTKEVLDSIQINDLVKVNNWKRPYKVKEVSDNYFVMSQNMFGKEYYSVCEKKRWEGTVRNAMRGGMFHIGTDHWVFGSPININFEDASFDNYEYADAYVKTFELEKSDINHSELSVRTSIPIYEIYIKRGR